MNRKDQNFPGHFDGNPTYFGQIRNSGNSVAGSALAVQFFELGRDQLGRRQEERRPGGAGSTKIIKL
jgi:hypothetical protein